MKYYLLILSLFFCLSAWAQKSNDISKNKVKNSKEAIIAGNEAAAAQRFEEAITYYFAAEAYDPSQRDKVKKLIDKVFISIQAVKDTAVASQIRAERALETARTERARAEEKEKEANEARVQADTSAAQAERAKIVADTATARAIRDKIVADRATTRAINSKKFADEQKVKAETQRNKAELLSIEALSTSIALKSMSMKNNYQDTLKGLLALEAFNMQMTMLKDTTKKEKTWLAAETYNALHGAMLKMKGENYDELRKEDGGHIGPVRSIFQVSEKSVYSLGSDGKIIHWTISEWNKNGKPTANAVEMTSHLDDKNDVIMNTSAAIKLDSTGTKEILAVGDRFSTVKLVNYKKKGKAKLPKLPQTHKNRNYETLNDEQISNVYDMLFYKETLYTLGTDLTIKVYDTALEQSKTIITLQEKAEHIAMHSNGNIIAVGYKDGNIDLFDINKLSESNEPLHQLRFNEIELKDKEITALAFEKDNNQLVFGTNDGYIGLIPMIDNGYNSENVKFRKVHSFIISTIDFKTFIDTEGQPFIVMAVGNYDGAVSVWLLKEFDEKQYKPFLFDDKSTFVTSLEFVDNPTDQAHNQLMVGYFDGTIKFWNLDILSLANGLQCALKGAKLSDAEKDDFNLNIKFDKKIYTNCME